MNKLKLYKLIYFSFTIIFLSLFQSMTVTATENPLLLLDYTEIDETHFIVNGTFSELPEVTVFSVPIAFDNQSVAICGYDSATGEFFEIQDGAKSDQEIREGKSGLTFTDIILASDQWNGKIICNDEYPYINNSEGIVKFALYSFNSKMKFGGENKAFSICFKRLNENPPEIRIATEKNSEYYDYAVPEGLLFVNSDDAINMAWKYSGDVFEDNSKIELPDWGKIEEENNQDSDNSNTNAGNNQTGGNNSSSTSAGTTAGSSNKNDTSENDIKEDKKEDITDNKSDNIQQLNFIDVDEAHWAWKFIYELAKSRVISGYEDFTFRPEAHITRAELAKLAVVSQNLDTTDNSEIFSDSTKNQWYNGFLTAAFKNNIIKGYPDGTFRPEDNVTREDLCTILYRVYFEHAEESSFSLTYTDTNEVSEYALEAVKLLSELKILNGRGENQFEPKGFATRAEVAKVIYLCAMAQ